MFSKQKILMILMIIMITPNAEAIKGQRRGSSVSPPPHPLDVLSCLGPYSIP